ncbi:MAG: L,D-transpeptidase family protein [Pseudomonadota bacterium]
MALVAACTFAGTAAAEVPVPRLSPLSGVTEASLSMADVGPQLPVPLEEAIRREAGVDVGIAVSEFYEARGYKPVWTQETADALRARLAEAALDGFDPADYFVPAAGLSPAAFDVSLTEAALRYAHHAMSGRIDPQSVSRIMTIEPPKLHEGRFLRRLARARNVAKVLDRLHPTHPQFLALRGALAKALDAGQDTRPLIGKGRNLRRGSEGVRVAALRSRLGATVMRGTDPTQFDDGLHEAVRDFQKAKGLGADGIVGPRTIAALDDGVGEDPSAELISNMERWRWLPRDLGKSHVIVNVPAYRVRVSHGNEMTYEGRVIVGKPGNPTPIFSDEIEHVIVNPYWNVPFSIASKEMLGGIQKNPAGYFARRGYEAVYKGRVVNPASLTWNKAMLRKVRVRQRPGRRNALGSVKFMFPNKHAVYLHDTPTKHLFKRSRRAFSHGCVRVDQPFVFAEALLAAEDKLSGKGLRRMVGGGQRHVNLETHIPVHLTYFTREVADDGSLVRLADVYGYDRRTRKALGL